MGYYSGPSTSWDDDDLERAERLQRLARQQEDMEELRHRSASEDERFTEEFSSYARQARQLCESGPGTPSKRMREQLEIIEDVERNVRASVDSHRDGLNRYCTEASMRMQDEADALRRGRENQPW
ncbi:hypothetical protein GA0061078_1444 [Bifidobacterium bohemicum]|uniref:Uncharacterized protein n=1 Tax=Bifidobacterium bohemicum DSM 22767 TaxID=1437606 RepID=A0A086ZH30_9BIFI|nr:hypothetical protein [Bifidobacterium bohemicum]KFI45830.1 hypothetical protein BBOH_0633 [Bifidobacterium bohemicum DSM 22767]SCC09877.1 hypothetical protein GA0061078_1444 [Bifidobacterium bohemicum]